MSETETTIPVGAFIGDRWRVGGFLGAGGFGQVYLAEDVSEVGLGSAAVKVLHPNTSPQERQSFLHEVKKIAALRHQNLVGYLDSGLVRFDGTMTNGAALPDLGGELRPYLVTELCEGSLADHLSGSPGGALSTVEAVSVLGDVTAGLAHLHDRGLIHRDIKPGNVLAADGRWKLADFGLMRDLSASGAYHRGDLIGTPLFMAPELFTSSVATAPSDVYAVGVVAHLCLTGRPLHSGTGPALVHNIATQPPAIGPTIEPAMADLIRWSSAADPARRPTAHQLAENLRRFATGAASTTVAAAPPVSFPPPHRAAAPTTPPPLPPPISDPRVSNGYSATGRATSKGLPLGLLGVGAAVFVLAFAGMAIGLWSLLDDGSDSAGGAGDDTADVGEGAPSTAVAAPTATSSAGVGTDVAGVEIGEGVELGDGVEIGGDEVTPATAGDTSAVIDPLSHLEGAPCSGGTVDQVRVTNRHSQAVDYRLTINHHDAADVRIAEAFDTATAVPPGGTALLAMASTEEGATGCDIAELVALPTDPFLLDDFDTVEIERCVRSSDTGADVAFIVSNPLDVPAAIEVSIVVTDPDGLIIDEWFSEDVDQVAPGERVRTEVDWTYFNLRPFDPSTPIGCVVSWLDLKPS